MRKKIFIAVLLLICMMLSLSSCFIVINRDDDTSSDNNAPIPTTDAETKADKKPIETFPPQTDALAKGEDLAEELMSSYLESGYEGKIVITLVGDYSYLFSSISGDENVTFSRAMGLRNELIESTFDCELEFQVKDFDTFFTEVTSAKNAGLFYSDIVIMPQGRFGELVQDKLLCNLADYCDYNNVAQTIDKENISRLSAGKNTFAVVGDALFSPSSYLCVYYNKALADSLGTGDLYDAVNKGEWTIGKMKGYNDAVSAKGEGYYCIGSDISDKTLCGALFTASGLGYMNSGLGVEPSLKGYGERTDSLIGELKSILTDRNVYCNNAEVDKKTLFKEGKMLFYIGTLAEVSDLDCNFGVLPLPKLDIAQDRYHTYVTEDAPIMCVLGTATDPKKSVDIINALNDASAMLFDGYIRDFLDFFASDGKSAAMLGLVKNSITFDLANALSGEYLTVRYGTQNALYETVTENKNIKQFYNEYRWMVLSDMRKVFPM